MLKSQPMRIFRRLFKEQNCYIMNKTILSTLGFVALNLSLVMAQKADFDPMNAREGELIEYCHSHKKQAELMMNPSAVASFAQDAIIRQQELENGVQTPKGTIYYIPIVFHILHNNGVENISNEQIFDAVEILNRDYRLLNQDANNVQADFLGLPADVEIEFRLATKAPNGTCFNGITRTVSALTYDGSSGNAQKNAVKNGNDVFQGEWPGDEYLNVFVCAEIGGAAGYTYTPSNWIGSGMGNGIWILHNYVGSIGTSGLYSSRTMTHETGHWLNLEHPWGGNNNPGNVSSCSTDDGVSDTPNTIGVTSCNLNEATCGPRANVENYMDYSYCSKMFTPGQVTRMRNAINSNIANRDNLITASNLLNTGADGNLYLCKADFEADRTSICAGQTIQFTDLSFNVVNGWTWTFQGGTPATSSTQNPIVTYTSPGVYQVTLEATDGSSNDSETKVGYIRVQPNAISIPFLEDFESFATLNNIDEWEVYNPGNNAKFELNTSFGHTGTKCVKLNNFGQPAGQTDELISAPVDLSVLQSTDDITLSFRYSYVKRYASNDEWLKVFISPDCGDNWAQRKTIHGDLLSPLAQNSSWTPSSMDDWTTVHMTNVTSNYFTGDFRYKFEFESDGGNNFYLDNINIYFGDPTDELSVETLGTEFKDFALYPNPADEEINLRFNVKNDVKASVVLTDLSGKVTQERTINAISGSNLVMMDTNKLAQGMYFVTLKAGSASQTLSLIIK